MIVSIDKASATHLDLPNNPAEWPRWQHARLTENLAQAGAAVIAFDIIFDKARTAADDQAFAEAMVRAGNVVLFEYLDPEVVPVVDERGPSRGKLHLERLVPPLPLLAHAAEAVVPFLLPKVPVRVNQYWTFKTGAGKTPTLSVVMFQLFAFEVYDEFLHLLATVHPAHTAPFPHDQAALRTTHGLVKFMRDVRELFTREPGLAESMLQALQRTTHLAVDEK